mmetsp:Transcript_26650/g.43804  ORF Transcript_26650/g.43804 Transcript_26650/m.43804 type:complete len:121 (-) Transcript_26650:1931-2293(-)
MSASKTVPPLHVLRGILRRLKVKTDLVDNTKFPSPTRNFVLHQYRASQAETSPEKIQELRKVAYEYFTLQQEIAERSRLHRMDTGAELQLSPRELSRRAAARAGLQLPDLNPELEKDLNR